MAAVQVLCGGLLASAHAQTLPANALPTGGVAVHGSAAISNPAANKLVVTTTNGAGTSHSAINWNSFSIGSGATTQFVQPSAASMSINRVVTNTPSQLFGTLSSNGQIVLVNQSGIAVGAGAVVDTAGFTASAVGMTQADAIAGRLRFAGSELGNATGALKVDGNIIARGGDVVLIAPSIELAKTAVVESAGGSVSLAAGQSVEITGRGLEGITLQVQAPADQAINLGTLKGDAVGIFAGTLRHSGIAQAVTADLVGGKVVLRAKGDAYVDGDAKILATSTNAGAQGGQVDVLGQRVSVGGNALIDVSGQGGGGNIRVGGGFQGKDLDVPNAQKTYFGPNATLKADALGNGNGGKVIVWADGQTKAYGNISAQGGPNGGGGGFVEVSGQEILVFDAEVNTLAAHGQTGTLLLDPKIININASGTALLTDVDQFSDTPAATATIGAGTIGAAATNVVLQAHDDINVNSAISMLNNGVGITMQAGQFITVGAPITTKGGTVTMVAKDPGASASSSESGIYVNAAIDTTAGGSIPGGATVSLTSFSSDAGGDSIQISAPINAGASSGVSLLGQQITQFAGGSISAQTLTASASSGQLTLGQANNITADVNLTASGAITFNNLYTGSVNFSGLNNTVGDATLTLSGGMSADNPINVAGNLSITAQGNVSFGDDVNVGGTLGVNTASANGAISGGTGAFTVTGLATFNAGLASINVSNSLNDFSSIALIGGTITVSDKNNLNLLGANVALNNNLTITTLGTLTLPVANFTVGNGDISITTGGPLATQGDVAGHNLSFTAAGGLSTNHNITATGTLSLNTAAGNGLIQQGTGAIMVAGATTINAGNNDINLFGAGNDFSTVNATGRSVSLVDVNGMDVAGLTNPGAINLYLQAGGQLTLPAATNLVASNQLSLFSGGTLTTAGNISAPTVSLAGASGLNLAHNVNASVLDLSSSFGNVHQSGGAVVATLVQNAAAPNGFVSLNQPLNDINSISATALGAVDIVDSGAAGIGHLNITGGSVSITAVGPILRHGGTITANGGPITLSGTSIGIPGGLLSDYVALDPGVGTVNLTATSGGIAVNQVAGDLTLANYNVSAAGIGQDLKVNLGPLAGLADVCFCGYNANTQDDRLFVTTQGASAFINVQGNLSVTAQELNLETQGANSHIYFTGGGANAQAVGGFNISTLMGGVVVDGNITNFTGPVSIQAASIVAGTGGVQAVGQNVSIVAGRNSGGFVSDGSGGISLAFVNSAGSNGFNNASSLIANGQNGGSINLALESGSTGVFNITTIDSRGGNGATLTSTGAGALGGNGGNISIQGDGATTSVVGAGIFSSGGRGGDASVAGMPGGGGGNAGQVNISAVNAGGLLFQNNVTSRGGDGGNAVAGATTAAGGAGGSAGNIYLEASDFLTFMSATTLDATGGSPGLDNTGTGGSYVSGDITLSGLTITQLAGAAIQTTATTVHMLAGGGGIILNEPGNLFGEMDGSSGGGALIVGTYGVGDGGFTATADLSLTGWPSQPLWIQGAISGANITLNGNSINIKDHILTAGNLNLSATGDVIQDQLGGGSNISVGGQTSVNTAGNVDLSGPANQLNTLQIPNANNVLVKSTTGMTINSLSATGFVDIESSGGDLQVFTSVNAGQGLVLKALGGALTASEYSLDAGSGAMTLVASGGIDVSFTSLAAVGDLDISTQGGPLNANGTTITGVTGNWRTYLNNYASGGHQFGPFDPLVNADYRQVNGNFGTILGTGNGSLWLDSGVINATFAGTVSKTYDGTTTMPLAAAFGSTLFLTGGGVIFAEPNVNVAGFTGTLSDPNVGTSKLVTVSGLSLDGAVTSANGKPTYGYTLNASGNVGTVNAAAVNVASLNGTRQYDGTSIVDASIFNILGLVGSETLTLSGAGSIADKNVGVNKPVTLGSLALGNGTNGGLASNYTLTGGTHVATITPRTSSTWSGGSGLWSDATKWDGGTAVPDGSNVLNAIIPAGSFVNYTSTNPNTTLQNILSSGTLSMGSGQLTVNDTLSTSVLVQNGGLINGAGRLVVDTGISKNAGAINMDGLVAITQTLGNLNIGSVSGGNIVLNVPQGKLAQNGPLMTGGLLAVHAATGIDLTNSGNQVAGLAGVADSGNFNFTNTYNGLAVSDIAVLGGNLKVDNTGGIVFTPGSIVKVSGNIDGLAHSPILVASGATLTAGGNITLAATNQTSAGNMFINGLVQSTGGNVTMLAANNFTQNGQVAALGGISAVAGGSITFGPLAISAGNPVSYKANGVPVLNPPGSLGELLARNNGTGSFINSFLNKFEEALEARADSNDGKKNKAELVVEGETCRP